MVNIRWAREAGFSAGFFFVIAMLALRAWNVHVGPIVLATLVVLHFCVFGVFYRIAKHRHS
jgi:hypothetical protein